MQACGANNVFGHIKQPAFTLNPEALLQQTAQIAFISNEGDLKQWQAFYSKSRQPPKIHSINADLRPSLRIKSSLEQMCLIIDTERRKPALIYSSHYDILWAMENQLEHLQICLNALIDKFNAQSGDNASLTSRIQELEQEKRQLIEQYDAQLASKEQAHTEQVNTLQTTSDKQISDLKVENTVLRATLIDTADAIKTLLSRLPKVVQEEIEQWVFHK